MLLAVRVTPRGGRDAVDCWTQDEAGRPVLRVRVSAAAADGAANAALVALLAKALKRPRSAIAIVSGHAARVKRLAVEGLSEPELHAALGVPPNAPR